MKMLVIILVVGLLLFLIGSTNPTNMDDKTFSYLFNVIAFVTLFSLGYWIVKRLSKSKTKYKSEKERDWEKRLGYDPKTKELLEHIVGAIVIFCVGFLIFKVVTSGFESVTGYFGGKSDAKEYCGRQHDVVNAKTDFAAKKAYKACLSNY